jgi:hypothetical protein
MEPPPPLGSFHGVGGGRRYNHGAAACEEEVAFGWRRRRRKKRPRWAMWAERLSRSAGRLSRLGRKLEKNSFRNKNWIFKYTKALEIYTRRCRRNFEVGIFPKFF